jgi:catechol 2,3-dioxygenase-like lactoylglutathione lyase family enzyme
MALAARLPSTSAAADTGPTRAGAPAAIRAVGPIGMTVADLDRSLDFYQRVLGFEQIGEVELVGESWERLHGVFGLRMRVATLRLGDERVLLTEYLTPPGRAIAADARANDRDFQHLAIVVRDMARAYAWLRDNRVRHASTGPQRLPDWNRAAAGIEAFYFRDPDGHFLELIAFPPDKGAARWHRPGDDLFLGIDHTAIVVADSGASLRLYRDLLGMRVAGESENSGTEQEHLNGVAGARLHITTLRAATGPGIELLEYVSPRDGRPAARDARASDVAHWQTRLTVDDVPDAAAALRAARIPFVSPGAVALPDAPLGSTSALVVRDPDGHAIELADDASSVARQESTP